MKIAIVGGGLAGLTAAWQLHQLGHDFTLYESTHRLGGTVETVRQNGFIIECGPDGWVTDKPWAAQLARDLGLQADLVESNDATRVTYILNHGQLAPMPDGMRMMVPTNLEALNQSHLFSEAAKTAYAAEPGRAEELKAAAPDHDESVATFVARHFGTEVLDKLAAPLLSGVFGGDVRTLSVRAVMPAFVQMEREQGSVITALQTRQRTTPQSAIFTTLKGGLQSLIDRLQADLPAASIHQDTTVEAIHPEGPKWTLSTSRGSSTYDSLILATPAHITRQLLTPTQPNLAELLEVEATSALIAAFAFDETFSLPRGFGFLIPFSEPSPLLACTFVDQKFPDRAPAGKRLIRAFFGGPSAPEILALSDQAIADLAFTELRKLLGHLPKPAITLVRRWPRSLPQYAVGHNDRIAQLKHQLPQNLHLLGNPYHGVGLPDLIRDARALAYSLNRNVSASLQGPPR